MQNVQDDWITLHPNGKEKDDYRRLFVEENESKADAIARKYPKKDNIQEKRQNLINNQKSYAESFSENKKLRIKTDNMGGYKEIDLSESGVNEEYFKKFKKYPEVLIKGGQMAKNPYYNAEKAVKKQEKKEQLQEKIKNFKPNVYQQAELNAIKENPNQAFINRQISYKPYKYDSKDTMQQTTDEKIIDHNDYWYIKNNPLSKVGVFPYLGKTISPDLEPNKIYYVYRSEEELNNQEFLDSLKLQPFIDEHTMLGTKPGMELPEDKGIDGTIGADVYYKDGIVYGDIKLYTERIKDEIDNGKKEISMGYFCDYEPQAGEYKGQPYQFKQKNLRVNHVALVREGRMGADVRVFDHKITLDTIEEIKEMTKINSNPPISALDENIEEITKTDDECNAKDEEIDKRQLIDEVGGILKDKLDEELWRTVMGKLEKIAYNESENANNDENIEVKTEELKEEPVKDEVVPPVEVKTEEKQDGKTDVNVSVSMDSMIKEIGQRDALVEAVRPLIGDNSKYKMMSTAQVAKYACDKLDLNVNNGQEVAVLRGYIAATKKQNKVTYSLDNAITSAPITDAAFEAYKKGV